MLFAGEFLDIFVFSDTGKHSLSNGITSPKEKVDLFLASMYSHKQSHNASLKKLQAATQHEQPQLEITASKCSDMSDFLVRR